MEEGWVKGKGATFWPQKRWLPSLVKITYTYDANGNLLREDEQNNVKKEYTYTGFDRIKTSQVSFGKTSGSITNTYRYDGLQRRILQEDKSQKTLRSVYMQTSLSVLNEWEVNRDGSAITNRQIGSRQYFYASGELYSIKEYRLPNSDIEYFYKDRQGSIKASAQGDGRIRKRIDYSVFGEPLGKWSLSAGYLSKPYDFNTRLSNYGFRDYALQTGRFTTVDPIRDGRNWYVYCNNDPVNWVDEWGLSAGDGKSFNSGLLVQAFQGVGEIIGGVAIITGTIYAGVKAEAAAVAAGGVLAFHVGQTIFTGITIGSAFIADGIQLVSNVLTKQKSKSLLPVILPAIIIDPIKDVGEGLSENE